MSSEAKHYGRHARLRRSLTRLSRLDEGLAPSFSGLRSVIIAVVAWCVVVALVAALAWWAIRSAGRQLGPAQRVTLSRVSIDAPTEAVAGPQTRAAQAPAAGGAQVAAGASSSGPGPAAVASSGATPAQAAAASTAATAALGSPPPSPVSLPWIFPPLATVPPPVPTPLSTPGGPSSAAAQPDRRPSRQGVSSSPAPAPTGSAGAKASNPPWFPAPGSARSAVPPGRGLQGTSSGAGQSPDGSTKTPGPGGAPRPGSLGSPGAQPASGGLRGSRPTTGGLVIAECLAGRVASWSAVPAQGWAVSGSGLGGAGGSGRRVMFSRPGWAIDVRVWCPPSGAPAFQSTGSAVR